MINKYLPGSQRWVLPKFAWKRLGAILFLCFGISATLLEWVNFGWFLRFKTDSFPMGLAISFAVVMIPVAEEAFFTVIGLTGRGRRILVRILAVLVLVGAGGYVYFAFWGASVSLRSVLSQQSTGIDPDSLRMACQLVASLSFSALCFSAFHSLGVTVPFVNPPYTEAIDQIKLKRREAAQHFRCIAGINGRLQKLQARKSKAHRFCRRQKTKAAAEFQRHFERLSQIYDEKL